MTVNRLILEVPSVTTTVVSKHLWETSPLPVTKNKNDELCCSRRNTLSYYTIDSECCQGINAMNMLPWVDGVMSSQVRVNGVKQFMDLRIKGGVI
jgi:hypothetical protein